MGLSNYIDEIIEQDYAIIVSEVPFKDILIDLRSTHVLSSGEVNRLRRCQDHKDAGFEFMEILKSRKDQDFFQFCQILENSKIVSVQRLGRKLKAAANEKGKVHG